MDAGLEDPQGDSATMTTRREGPPDYTFQGRFGWVENPPKKYRLPTSSDAVVEVSNDGSKFIEMPFIGGKPGQWITKFDGKLAEWVDARVEVLSEEEGNG